MATFNRFECFTLDLGDGLHDFGTDQIVLALTNSAPSSSADDNISDISQISYANLSSRNITTSSWSESGGVGALTLADLTLTASGDVAAWRYMVIYNSANGALIGWLDQTGEIEMHAGDSHVMNFGATAVRLGV